MSKPDRGAVVAIPESGRPAEVGSGSFVAAGSAGPREGSGRSCELDDKIGQICSLRPGRSGRSAEITLGGA